MIERAIDKWAPKLGQKGLECSILDILPAFLDYAMPQKFKDVNYEKVGYLVDGKTFMVEENRKYSNIKRLTYSSKTHSAGVLVLDYSIPMGLGIYHSPAMCGRCTEPALVKLCCDQPRFINFDEAPETDSTGGVNIFNANVKDKMAMKIYDSDDEH